MQSCVGPELCNWFDKQIFFPLQKIIPSCLFYCAHQFESPRLQAKLLRIYRFKLKMMILTLNNHSALFRITRPPQTRERHKNRLYISNREKSPSLFALPQPLQQSLGMWPQAFKLACTVGQTGGYNFSITEKEKRNSSLSNHVHNSPLLNWVTLYSERVI